MPGHPMVVSIIITITVVIIKTIFKVVIIKTIFKIVIIKTISKVVIIKPCFFQDARLPDDGGLPHGCTRINDASYAW